MAVVLTARRLTFSLPLLVGMAGAQASGEYQSMIDAILESNQGRVLVFAPTIFDKTLANALRQTRQDYIRKTNLRVLTVPYYNYLPDSTILSLALSGVPVHEAQIPSKEGVVIVDGQGWIGRDLGKFEMNSIRRMNSQEINKLLDWLKKSVKSAHFITQYEAFTRLKQVLK
ncbi:hypothetical protein [Deinococcus hopiensis]|uniref:hypothetical protein n=1 Tax=Deinococcus hopiensis TaxID=309885 RepID=UPI00111BF3C9|nr:hypothetical protein [Deinococcus hopiensis]